MDEYVVKGRTLWNVKGETTLQKCKPAGRGQVAKQAFMTAGAIAGAILLIGVMVAPLGAQSYPNRPIRFIVPYPPGATDILGRIIGQTLAERLGQPVVIENRPGAGGMIGIEMAAKAKPDGYTIVIGGPGALACSPSLYKRKLNFDPIKDFAPISLVAQTPWLLFVRSDHPMKDIKELVAYARANPGKLNYGSSGIGASPHLTCELFKSVAKINIVHVPYKGGGLALIGLMGGEVDMQVTNLSTVLPQVQGGKVRALVVFSKERLPALPNVPTAKEAGLDNCESTGWYGILAPAGTPPDIVRRLSAEWAKSVSMPNTKEQLQKAEFDPLSGSPEQFSEFLKAETIRWAKVIKEAKISLD